MNMSCNPGPTWVVLQKDDEYEEGVRNKTL